MSWHPDGKKLRKIALMGAPVLVAGGLFALACTWRPAIAPIDPPRAISFAPEQVRRGATLAGIGDCAVCHTAQGGRPLAGGRALATPFGTLFSTNITPDPNGIGRWSLNAFVRAMRDGVRRDGAHLYPALPYEHFTHVSDSDLAAIYAFLMSRRPVSDVAPANQLIPPLGFRPLLAGWKLLFLHKGPTPVDGGRSPEWNRGAYLAEGLAHCAACHSPRNIMGGEERSRPYAGGVAEGWRAPSLDASNPAARRWTADALYTFLRNGISPDHSAAAGPMGPVVEGLSSAPEADVRAIATYVASRMTKAGSAAAPGTRPAERSAFARDISPQGSTLFVGACAGCHGVGAPMNGQDRPSLALSTDLNDVDPTSAIQAVLRGIEPPVAGRGPKMPPFAENLTDEQVAATLTYARARFTRQAPWQHLKNAVTKARKESAQP